MTGRRVETKASIVTVHEMQTAQRTAPVRVAIAMTKMALQNLAMALPAMPQLAPQWIGSAIRPLTAKR